MLPIAGQTAGPTGLKIFVDTQGWPRNVIGYKKSNFFSASVYFYMIFKCHYYLNKILFIENVSTNNFLNIDVTFLDYYCTLILLSLVNNTDK